MRREALYSAVWNKPAVELAQEFGISGTMLKKICAQHDIPTPPRGYWAKVQVGMQPQKTQLAEGANVEIRMRQQPFVETDPKGATKKAGQVSDSDSKSNDRPKASAHMPAFDLLVLDSLAQRFSRSAAIRELVVSLSERVATLPPQKAAGVRAWISRMHSHARSEDPLKAALAAIALLSEDDVES